MIDYYSELALSSKLSIEELNNSLVKLENIWTRRELTNPEKSRKMLNMIQEAHSVFKDDNTKAEYDAELKGSMTDNSLDNKEKQSIHFLNEARKYLSNKTFDLAKIAIDKALNYSTNRDNCEILELASKIYAENELYEQAIDFSNQLIVLYPDKYMGYITKQEVLLLQHGKSTIVEEQERLILQIRDLKTSLAEVAQSKKDSVQFLRYVISLCKLSLKHYEYYKDYDWIDVAWKYANQAYTHASENNLLSDELLTVVNDVKKEILVDSELFNEEKKAIDNKDDDELYRIYSRMVSVYPEYYMSKLFLARIDLGRKYRPESILQAIKEYKNILQSSLYLVQKKYKDNINQLADQYIRIIDQVEAFVCDTVWPYYFSYTESESATKANRVYIATLNGETELYCTILDTIGNSIKDLNVDPELKTVVINRWKEIIDDYNKLLEDKYSRTFITETELKNIEELLYALRDKIKEYEKDYIFAMPKITNSSKVKGGGCYIATCVYGSYDCPEVWTLRRYRDNYLAQTYCGRLFIRVYYSTSPTIVKFFGKRKKFKKFFRKKLDIIVSKLNSNGIKNTPYKD